MFVIYAIYNPKGKIYIGQTKDLEKRLLRHNNQLPHKSTSYTAKNPGPWTLFYSEKCDNKIETNKREKGLKSSRGRSFLKSILPR